MTLLEEARAMLQQLKFSVPGEFEAGFNGAISEYCDELRDAIELLAKVVTKQQSQIEDLTRALEGRQRKAD